jgi:hypothetical protein
MYTLLGEHEKREKYKNNTIDIVILILISHSSEVAISGLKMGRIDDRLGRIDELGQDGLARVRFKRMRSRSILA